MDTPFEQVVTVRLTDCADTRLDKALARAVPEQIGLSRVKIAKMMAAGRVFDENGQAVRRNAKPSAGEYSLHVSRQPDPDPATPEDIPLDIIHEDAQVIVINKPAGMVVHPAVGNPRGTLLNALLHHCKADGAGVADRAGIVHRLDKDTTGLLVAAKSDMAHEALSAQFRNHSIKRHYMAVAMGVPNPAEPRLMGIAGVSAEAGVLRIATQIARHRFERKRMAVVASNGRGAITRAKVLETFGTPPLASLLECRLETGRTHQIRLHLAHIGHGLIGDPLYGRARTLRRAGTHDFVKQIEAFPRQALHAASIGFIHPKTKTFMEFNADLPQDMLDLIHLLRYKGDV